MVDPSTPEPDGRDGQARAFLAITAGASAAAFAFAFDLGAFGVVFFDRLQLIWALATATLVGSFVVRDRWRLSTGSRAALAMPTAWLAVNFVEAGRPGFVPDVVIVAVALGLLLSLPSMVLVLLSVVAPTFTGLHDRRLQAAAVVITVLLGLLGFGLGRANDRHLTCDDFVVSGNHTPVNCRPGGPTTVVFRP